MCKLRIQRFAWGLFREEVTITTTVRQRIFDRGKVQKTTGTIKKQERTTKGRKCVIVEKQQGL